MSKVVFAFAALAALASAPLTLSRREASAPARGAEVVSWPSLAPRSAVKLDTLEVNDAWRLAVACAAMGVPGPSDSGRRFVEAFFDGRLPSAAGHVRARLAELERSEAVTIADRARSFDRALVLLSPAPGALLEVFVERAEDPGAHLDVIRSNADGLARLVEHPELGERSFTLLRSAGSVPSNALKALGGRVARDAWARAALASAGPEAVPVLLESLDSADGARRAAAAWVLAGVAGSAHADRILQTALPELARDSVPGNAAFAIRALTALGERARPAVRGLLRSPDDQAVAAALQVLMKTGGARAEDLDCARARVERLASRAGEAGDEASIGLELRASLGVAAGAMKVPDPPETLNPSQTEAVRRAW